MLSEKIWLKTIICCIPIYKCMPSIQNTLCAVLYLLTLCTHLGCRLYLLLQLSLLISLSLCVFDIYIMYFPKLLCLYYHYSHC